MFKVSTCRCSRSHTHVAAYLAIKRDTEFAAKFSCRTITDVSDYGGCNQVPDAVSGDDALPPGINRASAHDMMGPWVADALPEARLRWPGLLVLTARSFPESGANHKA